MIFKGLSLIASPLLFAPIREIRKVYYGELVSIYFFECHKKGEMKWQKLNYRESSLSKV